MTRRKYLAKWTNSPGKKNAYFIYIFSGRRIVGIAIAVPFFYEIC